MPRQRSRGSGPCSPSSQRPRAYYSKAKLPRLRRREPALQYVADHAEALEIVDTASKRSTRRRRSHRFIVSLIAVACLAAISGGAYLYFTESVVIEKAKQQIDDRKYDEASRTIADLPHRWFFDQEATYLEAKVDFKSYASAKSINDGKRQERGEGRRASERLLTTSKERLKTLFTKETWHTQGKTDLANEVGQVPVAAEDCLPRALKIAQALNELKVADGVPLADALVKKAEDRRKVQEPTEPPLGTEDDGYIKLILDLDKTKPKTVVYLALPKEGLPPQNLPVIATFAKKSTSLRGDLSRAVLQIAQERVAAKKYPDAKVLVDAAKHIDPDRRVWEFWNSRFHDNDSDAEAAIAILQYMVAGESDDSHLNEAAELFNHLQQKHAGTKLTPPHNIRDKINAKQFGEIVAAAEQLVNDHHYKEARTKLDKASLLSSLDGDAKAHKLDEEVRFHDALDSATQSFKDGNWDAASKQVNEALKHRSDDEKNAKELQGKIQTAKDEAEVEQHRQKAHDAITANTHAARLTKYAKLMEFWKAIQR